MRTILTDDNMIIFNPKTIDVDYQDYEKKKDQSVYIVAEYDNGFVRISKKYRFAKSAEDLLRRIFEEIRIHDTVDMVELEKRMEEEND